MNWRDIFEYRDGGLYWKIKPSRNVFIGVEAGCVCGNGYRELKYKGKGYGVHRIVFYLHYGYMPEQVDHIDGNPLNNRAENLRAADKVKNGFNRQINNNNKSGHKNVSWNKATQKWSVSVQAHNKSHYFGRFDDLEIAILVASEARDKLHGYFARHK